MFTVAAAVLTLLVAAAIFSPDKAVRAQLERKNAKIPLDFSHFPDKSEEPQINFTWVEVSRYDGEHGRSLYIVVDCAVLDITDFAEYHPGGREVLKRHAGEDATAVMRATNMPDIVYVRYVKRFQVGHIIDLCPQNPA